MSSLSTQSTKRPSDEDLQRGQPSGTKIKRIDSAEYKGPELDDMSLDIKFGLKGDHFSHILVIYTGGTIGMKSVDGVLAPMPHYLVNILRDMPMFFDRMYADEIGLTRGDFTEPLVMPESKDGRRILYRIYEYDPVLDSCNITMTDWMKLALDIKHNYSHFDGFVVLHGTDTMAYSASALSFILENLGKPVIFTGSQIPIFETRSDGRDNFLGALIMAGSYCIPEVMVYFNNKLMRGCRVSKIDCDSFNAFVTPNMAPLAELEINIHINWDAVFNANTLVKMDTARNLCADVGVLRFFPGITESTVWQFLSPPIKGVVLQSYGAGNGPDSRKDILKLFEQAFKRDIVVVNITQCSRGTVSTTYAAGKALLDVGIIPGADMTPEAALTKLAYVLGKDELSISEKRKMMGTNIRGEMKIIEDNANVNDNKLVELPLLTKLKEAIGIASKEEVAILRECVFPNLICCAAKERNTQALQTLKEAGAVFSTADYDGRTALHIAASEGNLGVVEYLLKNNAMVHARDRYGVTALEDAIHFQRSDVIKLLVQAGAHLNMYPYKLGIELCLAAAKGDKHQIVSFALAGADLNQGDYDGRTALHIAVTHGSMDCIAALKQHGAQVDVRDKFGFSPLDEAEKSNKQDVINMLENWN